MRYLMHILLTLPVFCFGQRVEKDSALAYLNKYVKNNTRPVGGVVVNRALTLLNKSIIDSVYIRSDSLLLKFNGVEKVVQPSKTREFSDSLDFPDISTGNSHDTTITVLGAVDGDPVVVGTPNATVLAGIIYYGWVSAADAVTIRFYNYSGSNKNPARGRFKIKVLK
jgi:hypothetical protein